MSRLPIEVKDKALRLRKKGYSIKEISDKLNIAKSTSSLWVRNLELDEKARERLVKRRLIGYYKTALRWKEKNIEEELKYTEVGDEVVSKVSRNNESLKLFCSLLYWCEGSKGRVISFTNSDPLLIKTFLTTFRRGFTPNEKKFRILMHLHGYHNEKIQKNFWSKLTNIPRNQFNKTYHKLNTKKRIKENYQGCISLRYYDSKIAKELKAIYKSFVENMGTW